MAIKNYKSSNISIGIGMGGAIIIIILVVLCLTVFSVLSFTTAHSDLKLAEKTEEMTSDYYKTNGKAEEKLADIYEVLISACENMKVEDTPEVFFNTAVGELSEIDGVSIISSNWDSFKIYYEASGDKNQKICVTVNIMYDKINNYPYYNIETWNLSTIEPPVYEEENFDLWEGFE